MRMAVRWRRKIVCRDAVALVTEYLEGSMPAARRSRLERHLAACEGCEEYLREMRVSIAVTGRVELADLSPEALDDIVAVVLAYRSDPGAP